MLALQRKPYQSLTEIRDRIAEAGADMQVSTVYRSIEGLEGGGLVATMYQQGERRLERRCTLTPEGHKAMRTVAITLARLWPATKGESIGKGSDQKRAGAGAGKPSGKAGHA